MNMLQVMFEVDSQHKLKLPGFMNPLSAKWHSFIEIAGDKQIVKTLMVKMTTETNFFDKVN